MIRRLLPVLGAFAVLAGCGSDEPESSPPRPQGKVPTGPNVVVFLTDDENIDDIRAMPNVRRLLVGKGVAFPHSFVNFPLCCPSRATIQTGQYAHNHGVLGNHTPVGGYSKFDSANTLPVWLTSRGYRTAYVGKYMNGVKFNEPPGWQYWVAKGGSTDYNYYDYDLNENGRIVRYGSAPRDHADNVISRKAVGYVERTGGDRRPFLLMIGYQAPHSRRTTDLGCGPVPAPRDSGAFSDRPLPRGPAFNERRVSDKPTGVDDLPRLTAADRRDIRTRYRCRLESLLGVDRSVAGVVAALRRSGSLRDTFLIFTSDNGLLQGEHRIKGGKEEPYDEALKVPLIIRGPGIPHGARSRATAVNTDVAPTITALTGATPELTMDGRSLLPFARHPGRRSRRTVLIQANKFVGVRTPRYAYVERRSGQRELYDLERDPMELRNLTHDERYAAIQDRLAALLAELGECAGQSCLR
jgi:arylsulfatase A-like enzyme